MANISPGDAAIDTSTTPTRRPLRLLAFDGGFGGLSSLIILRRLMEMVAIAKGISDHDRGSLRPSEFFDLITGTGSGVISALFLGRLRMTVDEAIAAYQEVAAITAPQPRRFVSPALRRSSSSKRFEECVGNIILRYLNDRDAPLHDPNSIPSMCRTAVLAGTLHSTASPHIFRSYAPSMFTVLEVICASSPATESHSYTLGDPLMTFVNACVVGYGNPAKITLQEASSIWPEFNTHIDCLVSLGTGFQNLGQIGGKWKQNIKGAEQLAQNCEAIHRAVNFEIDTYFRFNVPGRLGPRDIREWIPTESATNSSAPIIEAYVREPEVVSLMDDCVDILIIEGTMAENCGSRNTSCSSSEPSSVDKDPRKRRRSHLPRFLGKYSLHRISCNVKSDRRGNSGSKLNPSPAGKEPLKRRRSLADMLRRVGKSSLDPKSSDTKFDRRNISSSKLKPSPAGDESAKKRQSLADMLRGVSKSSLGPKSIDTKFDPRNINRSNNTPLVDKQSRIMQESYMSAVTTQSPLRHSSSGAAPMNNPSLLRHAKSLPELSLFKLNKQTVEDNKPSLPHHSLRHRSRCVSLPSGRFDQEARPYDNQAVQTAFNSTLESRAGGSAADAQANWGPMLQNKSEIQQGLVCKHGMIDLSGVQLLGSENQLRNTMIALLDPSSSIRASRNLIHLSKFDDIRPTFVSKDIVPRVTALLKNPDKIIRLSAMHVLEELGAHGDLREILRKHTVSRVITLLSDQMVEMEVQQAALSLLRSLTQYDDICSEHKEDVIPRLVALLGNTSGTIHEQAVNILSNIIDESTSLSEEIVLQIVKPLNNPSEDISYTTTLLLSALAQKHDTLTSLLLRPGVIHELITYIGSNFIHVQCCVMKIMALFVKEEGIRTTLLDSNIFPTIANVLIMLINTTITPRMLHVLLWSLDRFLHYDELRSLILRSDIIYALAQLQSTEKLPADFQTLLSDLIADENLSLSFPPSPDNSPKSPFVSFQCLVGAQEAVDRVISEADTLKALLSSHQVSLQDYFVQAGFNEDLLASGIGHLEEIYIYLTKEVELPNLSRIIDGVERLFHPFPCVLLTAENSYRTLPPPGLPLGFDSIILERGDRQHQIMRMTSHSEEAYSLESKPSGKSAPHDGGDGGHASNGRNGDLVGGSGGGGGDDSGSQDDNKETSHNKKSEGSGGGDHSGSGNPPNNGDNNEPEGMKIGLNGADATKGTGIPEVACTSDIEVYLPYSSNPLSTGPPLQQDRLFQKFSMRLAVAIDVQPPSGPDPPSVSLQINKLGFYTKPLVSEHAYKHHKIEVKIDSSDKKLYPRSWHPESTDASGNTITYTNGRQLTGTLGLTAGTNGVMGNGTISGMISHARETTRNLSRVTALPGDTSVTWSYNVDDSNQQERGLALEQDRRPFLKFWLRKAQVHEPLRVEVSGYWVTSITPKKGVKFLTFKKPQAVPLLRNFCHLTCITIPSQLPQSAVSTLLLKARLPPTPDMCMVIEDTKEEDFEFNINMTGQVDLN